MMMRLKQFMMANDSSSTKQLAVYPRESSGKHAQHFRQVNQKKVSGKHDANLLIVMLHDGSPEMSNNKQQARISLQANY